MSNHVVITSIFEPTKAVVDFSKKPDNKVIVAGDKKSPKDWHLDNVVFLSADEKYGFNLEEKLPFNHYTRKMLGYLFAIREGAQYIYETDDDNLPKANWHIPSFEGEYDITAQNQGFVNIYNHYTEQKIWPRGFPLDLINAKNPVAINEKTRAKIGILQGLADGDPDVDAIYRLTSNEPCVFNPGEPLILNDGTYCPFNSQNTIHIKEVFPLLYLPSTVTFRFTDILRGLVSQPILHHHGFKLAFFEATVFQERNFHDYVKDFESEIPCYLEGKRVIQIVENAVKSGASIGGNLFNAYEALCNAKIVEPQELELLEAWLSDI